MRRKRLIFPFTKCTEESITSFHKILQKSGCPLRKCYEHYSFFKRKAPANSLFIILVPANNVFKYYFDYLQAPANSQNMIKGLFADACKYYLRNNEWAQHDLKKLALDQ